MPLLSTQLKPLLSIPIVPIVPIVIAAQHILCSAQYTASVGISYI